MLPICYEGLLTFLTEILRLKVCSAVCSCYLIHKYFVSISTYVLVKCEVGVGVYLFLGLGLGLKIDSGKKYAVSKLSGSVWTWP